MDLRHNDPVIRRSERGLRRPRKRLDVVLVGVTVAAVSIALAACSTSSPQTTNSPKLAGSATIDVSGQVVAHYTKHCLVGTDSVPNQVTVAFPSVAKMSDTPVNLVIYAPKTSASSTYPASSTAAAVRLASTNGSHTWANSSGTVTVSNGGTAGSIDLTMAPTPASTNQATGTVHVQGSWTGCATA